MPSTPPADRLVLRFLRNGTKPFRIPGWTWRAWGPRTVELGLWQLNTFHAWAVDQDPPVDLPAVTTGDLDAFVWHLEHRPAADGGPWSASAVQGMVQTLRRFYAWLELEGDLDDGARRGSSPARYLQAGRRVEETGPTVRQIKITEAEHRAMLKACSRGTLLGRRSAAILSTFWATGMRRAELHSLDRDAVDLDTGVLRLGHVKGGGKGLGVLDQEAREAVDRYLDRRRLDGEPALFVTHQRGFDRGRLGLEAIGATVRDAAHRAHLPRVVACHEYRRTFFTEQARDGATTQDLEALGGWRPGSRMPRRYMGDAAQEVAVENLLRRRADAAERARQRRRGA